MVGLSFGGETDDHLRRTGRQLLQAHGQLRLTLPARLPFWLPKATSELTFLHSSCELAMPFRHHKPSPPVLQHSFSDKKPTVAHETHLRQPLTP